mmetsp:Transcript_25270/g.52496  ORF Transcript_25270/g.52496 Transcript_25270/m.52496 type:complete len:551 (-) Transcript_25270:32-1684(-)
MSFFNTTANTLSLQGELCGEILAKLYKNAISSSSSSSSSSDYLLNHSSSLFSSYQSSLNNLPTAALSYFQEYKLWWLKLLEDNPIHVFVETILTVMIIVVLYRGNSSSRKKSGQYDEKLTAKEKAELLASWKTSPLVPPLTAAERRVCERNSTNVVTSYTGSHVTTAASGRPMLNLSSFDFLGMGVSDAVKGAAEDTLKTYGCGSCGPRGFYGTIKPHLTLEDTFAKLCGVSSSIMYSDGASTSSSTVAAFAKRGDLLVVDSGCFEGLLTGVNLSRSNVKTFKHNDPADLRRVLEKVVAEDRRLGRNVLQQRRFIVAEGLYRNYGTILNLPEIVKLKEEFKFRLLIDESLSFGVLGPRLLGVTDLYGLPHAAEITTVSLENALGSVGGITVGDEEVVDHQRLSGAGYCFSASAPPFVSSASVAALGVLEAESGRLAAALEENTKALRRALDGLPQLAVVSDPRSPVLYARLSDAAAEGRDYDGQNSVLQAVAARCADLGVSLVATGDHVTGHLLMDRPRPMIRCVVNVMVGRKMVEEAGRVIKRACKECV